MPGGQPAVAIGPSHEPQHKLGQYQNELIELLRGVVDHGTGRAAALPGFAAGKTGTAQDYRDAWFIGFNDSLVVGVWVGNDDHSPMRGVVGGSLPVTIWKRFMEQANPAPSASGQQAHQTMPPTAPPLQMPPVAEQAQPPNQLFDQSTAGGVPNAIFQSASALIAPSALPIAPISPTRVVRGDSAIDRVR